MKNIKMAHKYEKELKITQEMKDYAEREKMNKFIFLKSKEGYSFFPVIGNSHKALCKSNNLEIEQNIRKLVFLLNQVNYIYTSESCEGHFTKKKNNNAYIVFYLNKYRQASNENKLEKLIKNILLENEKKPSAIVEVSKRYWADFDSDLNQHYIEKYWKIEMQSFNKSRAGKKKETDLAIESVSHAILNYLKKYPQFRLK